MFHSVSMVDVREGGEWWRVLFPVWEIDINPKMTQIKVSTEISTSKGRFVVQSEHTMKGSGSKGKSRKMSPRKGQLRSEVRRALSIVLRT